eukprot:3457768-Amphidinium_carterae.1
MPPQSSASTTLLPQTANRLDQLQMYETGSFQTAVNSIDAALTVDREYTNQTQVKQWAILIDTGAMTSVASKDHFRNIPMESLRADDPHTHSRLSTEKKYTSTE